MKTSLERQCQMLEGGGYLTFVSRYHPVYLGPDQEKNCRVRVHSFFLSWDIHILLSLDVDASGPWAFQFDLGLGSTGHGDFGFSQKHQPWLSGQLIKALSVPTTTSATPAYKITFYVSTFLMFLLLWGTWTNKMKKLSYCGDSWELRTFIFPLWILDAVFNLAFKTLRKTQQLANAAKQKNLKMMVLSEAIQSKRAWFM